MHVFVTGATGFVGTAVVRELLDHGHRVTGLARSDDSAAALSNSGAAVLRGSLEDHDSLRAGAAAADGVAHLAFNHDFSRFAENGLVEAHAVEVIGDALAGTDKPLLVTSGVALLAQGRVATEADSPPAGEFPRKSEVAAAALEARGVRACVIRLSPSVHGEGDRIGFVPILIDLARRTGESAYLDEGLNRWPAVHRLDAARLYRLALEHGGGGGPFHGVAEEGVPMRQIAEAIGRRLGVPAVSRPRTEAQAIFGWFAMFAAADIAASSARTQTALGWHPAGPTLLADLDSSVYFPG